MEENKRFINCRSNRTCTCTTEKRKYQAMGCNQRSTTLFNPYTVSDSNTLKGKSILEANLNMLQIGMFSIISNSSRWAAAATLISGILRPAKGSSPNKQCIGFPCTSCSKHRTANRRWCSKDPRPGFGQSLSAARSWRSRSWGWQSPSDPREHYLRIW